MVEAEFENVYGAPPAELAGSSIDARQFSPLIPGADDLGDIAPASLNGLAMLAPPGTIERRHAIAQALQALHADARLLVLAPKDKGGSRLAGDLKLLGCIFDEAARRHHRICVTRGPGDAAAIASAIEDGAPRLVETTGLWSQPGVFSWDRIDHGSALLIAHLPTLAGAGADFGCGIGVLTQAVLASPKITQLTMIDIDRRAIAMARRNVDDVRAKLIWADARTANNLIGLDFVVMNPPFHDGGVEDQSLGQGFIKSAAMALRNGGMLWLTANRHLPYEGILKPLFRRVNAVAELEGFKIYQAQK